MRSLHRSWKWAISPEFVIAFWGACWATYARLMRRGAASLALGGAVGLVLGVAVSVLTGVPLAPEGGLVLGLLAGWRLPRGDAGAQRS
jgi:hypothetical protein